MKRTKKTSYVISLIGPKNKEKLYYSSTDAETGEHILYTFKGFAWRFESRKEAMEYAKRLFKGHPVMDTVQIERVVDTFPSFQLNENGEYV